MFAHLDRLPDDPILALAAAYAADKNPSRVDLTVGIYKDGLGNSPVLRAVREAERRHIEQQTTKAYIGIAGERQFIAEMEKLVFGDDWLSSDSARIRSVQTPGGCAALYAAAMLIRQSNPTARIWVSDPTWPNHVPIFKAANLTIMLYPYYDRTRQTILFDRMMAALHEALPGDVLLLHGSCHNPSGADLSADQWAAVAEFARGRGLVPLVDLAYQGFGDSVEQDVALLRRYGPLFPEMLVSVSCSKNFGLYRDRVGLLSMIAGSDREADAALSQVLKIARTSYSMPPAHGAAVVRTILSSPELRDMWIDELSGMRARIQDMRRQLARSLSGRLNQDFSYLEAGRGMFSFLDLPTSGIARLRSEFAVYMADSGRINLCGLAASNLDYVADAMTHVWRDAVVGAQ